MLKKIKIPATLQKMSHVFLSAGFEAYLVGGAVRDMLLHKNPTDYDIATNATPEQVKKLFKHVIPTGIEHGTVTVIFGEHNVEVTTYRIEKDYTDGRRPNSIQYTSNLTEDLSRRDFTMNAAAASLIDGTVIDPFGAQNDIKKRLICAVGNPAERFAEDGLRPVRAVRFAAQVEFTIEPNTLNAIPLSLETTKKVAVERFRVEFEKMLSARLPSIGIHLMEQTGLLRLFLPELADCRGIEQGGFHSYDVLDHLIFSCDFAPKNNLTVRLAALFHDIGKPACQKRDESAFSKGIIKHTFYQHENVSAKITEKILERLRFPKQIIKNTVHLIKHHMFHYEDNWSDAAVRRFLVRINAENAHSAVLHDLFDLRRADMYGMTKTVPPADMLLPFQDRIEKVFEQKNALNLKSLAINGADLIEEGIPSGTQIGYILQELLNTVLDDPTMNQKEKLIIIAQNLHLKF